MNPKAFSVARDVVGTRTAPAFECLLDRGYTMVSVPGLYPHVRAERTVATTVLSVDFWMQLDERGRYRENWSDDVAFELGGTATIDRNEGASLVRYSRPHILYAARPFNLALDTLANDILALAEVLDGWSEEVILTSGRRRVLPV